MKKILVIGAGLIGSRHIRHVEAHPACELAGIVEPDLEIASQFDCKHFASIEVVNVPVDGAIIATPNGLHLDHARQCAGRGWHLLIEKPVTETIAEADQLVQATDTAGVRTLIGHHRRYHNSVSKLKQILEDKEIGNPVTATAIWAVKKPDAYFEGNWREGPHGSPILINLVHDIDLLRHLLGDIEDVGGFGSSPIRGAERLESGAVVLRFSSGCVAAISFADTAPSPWGFEAGTGENPNIGATWQDMLWITGTKGGVCFPSLTIWSGAQDWSQSAKPRQISVTPNVPLDAQLEHFCELMDGEVEPMISAADGRETLRVALAAQSAIASK